MTEVSKLQKELMDHTMRNHGRNWFATSASTPDGKAFYELVELGLATAEKVAKQTGDDVIFRLTPEGKARQKQL